MSLHKNWLQLMMGQVHFLKCSTHCGWMRCRLQKISVILNSSQRETIKHLHKSSKRGTISKQIMTFKFSILTISPNNLFLPLNNAQCMKNYFSCNSTSTGILNPKQKVETQCPFSKRALCELMMPRFIWAIKHLQLSHLGLCWISSLRMKKRCCAERSLPSHFCYWTAGTFKSLAFKSLDPTGSIHKSLLIQNDR